MFNYMYILYLLFTSVFFTWFVCLPIFHLFFKRIFGIALKFRLIYALLLSWNILDATFLSIFSNSTPYYTALSLVFAFCVMFIISYFIAYLVNKKSFKDFILISAISFLSKYPAIFVIYLVNNFL